MRRDRSGFTISRESLDSIDQPAQIAAGQIVEAGSRRRAPARLPQGDERSHFIHIERLDLEIRKQLFVTDGVTAGGAATDKDMHIGGPARGRRQRVKKTGFVPVIGAGTGIVDGVEAEHQQSVGIALSQQPRRDNDAVAKGFEDIEAGLPAHQQWRAQARGDLVADLDKGLFGRMALLIRGEK